MPTKGANSRETRINFQYKGRMREDRVWWAGRPLPPAPGWLLQLNGFDLDDIPCQRSGHFGGDAGAFGCGVVLGLARVGAGFFRAVRLGLQGFHGLSVARVIESVNFSRHV